MKNIFGVMKNVRKLIFAKRKSPKSFLALLCMCSLFLIVGCYDLDDFKHEPWPWSLVSEKEVACSPKRHPFCINNLSDETIERIYCVNNYSNDGWSKPYPRSGIFDSVPPRARRYGSMGFTVFRSRRVEEKAILRFSSGRRLVLDVNCFNLLKEGDYSYETKMLTVFPDFTHEWK